MEISGLAFWWLDCFDGCRNPAKHHRLDVNKNPVNSGIIQKTSTGERRSSEALEGIFTFWRCGLKGKGLFTKVKRSPSTAFLEKNIYCDDLL